MLNAAFLSEPEPAPSLPPGIPAPISDGSPVQWTSGLRQLLVDEPSLSLSSIAVTLLRSLHAFSSTNIID